MGSAFDGCTDSCGWTAAVIAALAYGSFGVPIKFTKDIDVHPLILQSYKTLMIFLMGWLTPLLGVEIVFTKWGLLSGLLWVLGGTGGIYGIRMAGLAIAVGTWGSIMVICNFMFGIIIFQEPVHDMFGTISSFFLLILGLVGMSKYSAPKKNQKEVDIEKPSPDQAMEEELYEEENKHHVVLFGGRLPLTKRQCGIIGAACNGVLTGCSLVPIHYAKEDGFGGARYMLSMACGAFIANILVWTVYYLVECVKTSSPSVAFQSMPPVHFRQLWRPGFLAGVLLAIAMFGSILAVTYLGQGVGNSLVQTKILISGLWGIFWFKEITGSETITKWFLSAGVTVTAIIWLSLERLESNGGDLEHRQLLEIF